MTGITKRLCWFGVVMLTTSVVVGCVSTHSHTNQNLRTTTSNSHEAAIAPYNGTAQSQNQGVYPRTAVNVASSMSADLPNTTSKADISQHSQVVSRTSYDQSETLPAPVPPEKLDPVNTSSGIQQPALPQVNPNDMPSENGELDLNQLIVEVERRNPSLQAISDAWRAAAEKYPQMVSLEDPMFGFMVSPGTGPEGGWMAEASQKLPWAGKRYLRGSIAQAEADTAKGEIGDVRLRLAEATKMAFFDYYLARREFEVNSNTMDIVRQFRDIAKNKYESNQATEQDVLQAEVELSELESRRLEIEREEKIAIARINTLLHLPANCPLSHPPSEIAVPERLPLPEILQETAIRSRPDLYAQIARIRAEEAAVELACKEFKPDLEVVGKYDAFMTDNDMRPQVGMRLNVPIQRDRRWAAVREAQARLRQQRAEYQNRIDQVRFEVQSAYERLSEGQRVVQLYRTKILPTTEQYLKSAQANYTAGKVDFLRLVDAERQLNSQREKYYQAIAEYHRRAAELERAVGGTLPEEMILR